MVANWRSGLQGKTLLKVIPLAMIALALMWIVVAQSAHNQKKKILRDSLIKSLVFDAEIVALSLGNLANSLRNAATNSITVGALVGQDIERVVKPFLSTYAVNATKEHRVAIADYQGVVIVSNGADLAWLEQRNSRKWLEFALNGQEYFSIFGNKLLFSVPIFLGSTPDGALVGEIHLDNLDVFSWQQLNSDGAKIVLRQTEGELEDTEVSFSQNEAGDLRGELVVDIQEIPGIGLKLVHQLKLQSGVNDPVQRFLVVVFLILFAIVILSCVVSANLAAAPVKKLIELVDESDLEVPEALPGAPIEIQRLTSCFAKAGADVREALRQEKLLSAQQRKFVALVSHEIRTPLAIIDGAAGALQRRRTRMSDEKIESNLCKIRGSVTRLTRLMESTLTASRLEAGAMSVNPRPFDLRSLLDQLVEERRAISGHAAIYAKIDDLPDTVEVDDRLIYIVFDNLVSNAVKYGGDSPKVEIYGRVEQSAVAVTVRDYGLGIPADELPKVGQPYFRASTADGFPGSGVGLNTVKSIVAKHGGDMQIESELGVGSTFTVRFPCRLSAECAGATAMVCSQPAPKLEPETLQYCNRIDG